MQTKLLKKIRKRYSVTHYEKGFWCFEEFFPGEYLIVRDENKPYRFEGIQITDSKKKNVGFEVPTFEEARKKAFTIMLIWLRKDFRPTIKDHKKAEGKKIYYNSNNKL